jgi:hypothetical protein
MADPPTSVVAGLRTGVCRRQNRWHKWRQNRCNRGYFKPVLTLYSGHYINTHSRRQNFIAWLILTASTLALVLVLKLLL